jgi:adiponectin receptor
MEKPEEYRVGLTKQQAPPYVTYPYVLKGYRTGGTYSRCLRALFEWHSETMNAWTMIVGALLSAALLAAAWVRLQPTLATGLPFLVLTTSVWLHMPFSVGFHLFRGMNPMVYNLWRRLDQVFIFQVSILLTFSLSFYVYSWRGIAANTLAAAMVAQTATVDIWSLSPTYQRNRNHMVVFVGSIVLCYWFPMVYQAVTDLCSGHGATPAVWLAAGTFTVLQLGGVIFAHGFPEKQFPGVFDTVGFSHQLMHVCAFLAHAMEYAFVVSMYLRHHRLAAVAAGSSGVAIEGVAEFSSSSSSSGVGFSGLGSTTAQLDVLGASMASIM